MAFFSDIDSSVLKCYCCCCCFCRLTPPRLACTADNTHKITDHFNSHCIDVISQCLLYIIWFHVRAYSNERIHAPILFCFGTFPFRHFYAYRRFFGCHTSEQKLCHVTCVFEYKEAIGCTSHFINQTLQRNMWSICTFGASVYFQLIVERYHSNKMHRLAFSFPHS